MGRIQMMFSVEQTKMLSFANLNEFQYDKCFDYKIIGMGIRLRCAILIYCVLMKALARQDCQCLNGGICTQQTKSRCLCPSSYIGKSCDLPASEISNSEQKTSLSSNFSFFYFQPTRNIYYLLNFNICMLANPSNVSTLVFIQTQGGEGSLKVVPSMLKTAIMNLPSETCSVFSTHYIEVKRRADGSYHKIVMGIRLFDSDTDLEFVTLHPSSTAFANQTDAATVLPNTQSILLSMEYEVYIQANFYETFLLLSAAFALMLIISTFLAYLRRQNSLRHLDRTFRRLNRRHRAIERRRFINPEQILRHRRMHQFDIESFMPTKRYQKPEPPSSTTDISMNEQESQTCSICLLQFRQNDAVRTTPCEHTFHCECLDSWWRSKGSCPICRRQFAQNNLEQQINLAILRTYLGLAV